MLSESPAAELAVRVTCKRDGLFDACLYIMDKLVSACYIGLIAGDVVWAGTAEFCCLLVDLGEAFPGSRSVTSPAWAWFTTFNFPFSFVNNGRFSLGDGG